MKQPVPLPTRPPIRSQKVGCLFVVFLAQSVLCVALVVFLCLKLYEAEQASQLGQELYMTGYRDGGVQVIIQLERARLKRELIEEQLAAARREKL